MAAPPLRLPTNQPLGINPHDTDVRHLWSSAYDHSLGHQNGDSQQQLYARCLGYLLRDAVDETSRDYVAAKIIRCKRCIQKLNDLPKFYIDHIFRLCELGIANRFHFNADLSRVIAVPQNRAGCLRNHFTSVVIPLKHPKNRSTPPQSNPYRKTIQPQTKRSVPIIPPETAKRPNIPRGSMARRLPVHGHREIRHQLHCDFTYGCARRPPRVRLQDREHAPGTHPPSVHQQRFQLRGLSFRLYRCLAGARRAPDS